MALNFEAVVSVLLQICGQICPGMPYPCIFVEEVVLLLGEMTDKLVLNCVCGWNWNISNDLVKVSAKIESAKFFACGLWVEGVGTFGVVLCRNQWPVNFNLHFGELHSNNYINDKNNLFENYIPKCYKSKEF